MKKIRTLGTLFAGLMLSHAVMAAPVKIIYANYLGPKHPINGTLTQLFENIEKDTENSVEIVPYFSSSLLGGRDIPAGVRDGIADSGFFIGSYVPSEMKIDTFLTDLGVLNDDALAMTGVLNELLLIECESCAQEYKENFNTIYLGSYATTPYVYHCTTEKKDLNDFKGSKLQGFSYYNDLGKSLGAAVLNMGADDAFEALDRNVIECAIHTISAQRARSWGDVAKFVLTEPLGGFFGGSVFNMRTEKWNELDEGQKQAIIDNLPQFVAQSAVTYLTEDAAVQKDYAEKGTTFYSADDDLAASIREFQNNYAQQAVKTAERRGVENPQEILDKVITLKKKWDDLLDEHGRDVDTFASLLKEHIYDRVEF